MALFPQIYDFFCQFLSKQTFIFKTFSSTGFARMRMNLKHCPYTLPLVSFLRSPYSIDMCGKIFVLCSQIHVTFDFDLFQS